HRVEGELLAVAPRLGQVRDPAHTEGVHRDHLLALREEPVAEVRPDEAGPSGHQVRAHELEDIRWVVPYRRASGITNRKAVCVSENRMTLLSTRPAATPARMTSTSRSSFRPFGNTAQTAPLRSMKDSRRASRSSPASSWTATTSMAEPRRARAETSAPAATSSS